VTGKGTACMEPIDKCLSDPINYVRDEWGDFYCPKCDDGFTWAYTEEDDEQIGACTECEEAIPNCLKCDFHGTCRKCATGTFLSLDKKQCAD